MIRSAGSRPAPGTGLAPAAVRPRARRDPSPPDESGRSASADRAAAQAGGPVSSVLSVEETEALVRRVDYEGMPEDEAARIGADGTARLIEMLADPDEAPHHARILLALGISGGEGAFEAIRRVGRCRGPPTGSSTGPGFAPGRLFPSRSASSPAAIRGRSRGSPRVFDAEAPDWSFRHFDGRAPPGARAARGGGGPGGDGDTRGAARAR